MSKKGYKVISTETIQPKSGCLRILALGLFFKPKPFTQVTYELQPDSA